MPSRELILSALLCHLLVHPTKGNTSSEDNLISTLLNGYIKNARPPPLDQPTNVSLDFYLGSIDELDERHGILTVSAYLEAQWTDTRLAWNKSRWNDLDMVAISAESVWKPDFALVNAVGDIYNPAYFSDYYIISVTSDGTMDWTPKGSIAIRCEFELSYYPFDTQECTFRYENWVYPSYLSALSSPADVMHTDNYFKSGEWDLLETSAIQKDYAYGGFGNYSDVLFTLKIQRKHWYYVLNIVLPCVLLSALTCFLFLLPAESGERIVMGITLLLSFSIFQLLVAGDLPKTSVFTPLLSIYVFLAMVLTGISLVFTILVLRLAHGGNDPVPPWVEKFVMGKLGTLTRITRKSTRISSFDTDFITPAIAPDEKIRTETENANIHATLPAPADTAVPSILKTVRSIEKMMRDHRRQENNQKKWHDISAVVDRTLFILFTLTVILLSVSCLSILPSQTTNK